MKTIAFSPWRANIVCLFSFFLYYTQEAAAQTPFDYGWQVGYDVSKLFIGGDFRNASRQETNLVALNPATGKVISTWKGSLNHYSSSSNFQVVSPVVQSSVVNGKGSLYRRVFSTLTDKSLNTRTAI